MGATDSVFTTVLLPAYNEAQDLPPLLERIARALDGRLEYRILVVDDGSTDDTAPIASSMAETLPIELIRHDRNAGLGAAIRTGLRAASRATGAVVTMDADNTQDPALIPSMVERLGESADVVIASRFQPGGAEIGVPALRRALSHTASRVLHWVAPFPGVTDYSCGYRAYRTEVVRRLIEVFGDGFVCENGFACMLEILLNLRAIGARASEVPLRLRYDLKAGVSKIRITRTIWRYAVTIARGLQPLSRRARSAGTPLPVPSGDPGAWPKS
jgi:dolichol-phosphate mannosyltransferase